MKELYEYIATGKSKDGVTKHISDAVNKARLNEKWRTEYMKERLIFEDYRREGIREGLEKGELNKEKTLVDKWTQKGMDINEIAEMLDQTPEYVLNLMQMQLN